MKTPVGKLTLPLNVSVLNSWLKVVVDTDMLGVKVKWGDHPELTSSISPRAEENHIFINVGRNDVER